MRTIPGFDRIGEENAFAVLARAAELAQGGMDVINLGIGQPDFETPANIVEAAVKALRDGDRERARSIMSDHMETAWKLMREQEIEMESRFISE